MCFLSPLKCYLPMFPCLCHGIVLYPPSKSFHSPHAGRGWLYAHVIPSIYTVYPKSLIGPLAVYNRCFSSQREPNQKRAVHLVVSCNDIICRPLSLTFILYLQHKSVLWSLKTLLSRFPLGNDSGLRWPTCWGHDKSGTDSITRLAVSICISSQRALHSHQSQRQV